MNQVQLNNNADFLELLLNTMPNPVFYKNSEGIYEHCNDAFSKIILGIPKEVIVGKSLFDIPEHIPNQLALIYKEKDQYLFDNPGTQIYDSDVKCADGEIRRFTFHKSTLLDENGKVKGIVGVMVDITENHQIYEQLKQKNAQLEEISYKDGLTDIYNRRMFDEVFIKFLKNAGRNNNTFNLVILDVDQFKLYNDNFGHLKGDDALISIAQVLKKTMRRDEDYCFRLGGEEFALLFTTNDKDSACSIAKKVKDDIENLNIPHLTKYKKITASLGLISVIDDYMGDIDHYYKEADRLLYKAKENGRNQICDMIM